MDEPLVVDSAGAQRWIMSPPSDPHGDGYVAHLPVELHDDGLYAKTVETIHADPAEGADDLAAFVQQLADDWHGWPGQRNWHALEGEMTVAATHDGRGHVTLQVTVRRHRSSHADDAWSATIALTLEAGEQMIALAREVRALLAPTSPQAD